MNRKQKNKNVDEEFVHIFHDPDIVSLLLTDPNSLFKNPLNEKLHVQFLNLFKNKQIRQPLLTELFTNDDGIHNKILELSDANNPKSFFNFVLTKDKKPLSTQNNLFDILPNYAKKINVENVRKIFLLYTHDESLVDRNIDVFMKTNRRFTLKLCIPILEMDPGVEYCGVAKLPGIWIASSIRENKKMLSMQKFLKNRKYKRQQHLVESCSRQILRSESQKFLGDCLFSITFYESLKNRINLVRINFPVLKFMICLNVTKDLLGSFDSIIENIIIPFRIKLNSFSSEFEESFTNETKTDILFQYKTGEFKNDLGSNKFEINFNDMCRPIKKLRWAVITSKTGSPYCRYENPDANPKLYAKGPDELENLVETCVRQISRNYLEEFFGPVQYTLSVYEKIIKITIPFMKGKYIFMCSLESKLVPTTGTIKEVFDLLHDEKITKILESTKI